MHFISFALAFLSLGLLHTQAQNSTENGNGNQNVTELDEGEYCQATSNATIKCKPGLVCLIGTNSSQTTQGTCRKEVREPKEASVGDKCGNVESNIVNCAAGLSCENGYCRSHSDTTTTSEMPKETTREPNSDTAQTATTSQSVLSTLTTVFTKSTETIVTSVRTKVEDSKTSIWTFVTSVPTEAAVTEVQVVDGTKVVVRTPLNAVSRPKSEDSSAEDYHTQLFVSICALIIILLSV